MVVLQPHIPKQEPTNNIEEHKSLGSEPQQNDGPGGRPEYYTVMLDRERHKDQIESLLSEILLRIKKPEKNLKNHPEIKNHSPEDCRNGLNDLTIWLAPHYSILNLATIQQNDMLVIGTHEQLEAASTFK